MLFNIRAVDLLFTTCKYIDVENRPSRSQTVRKGEREREINSLIRQILGFFSPCIKYGPLVIKALAESREYYYLNAVRNKHCAVRGSQMAEGRNLDGRGLKICSPLNAYAEIRFCPR